MEDTSRSCWVKERRRKRCQVVMRGRTIAGLSRIDRGRVEVRIQLLVLTIHICIVYRLNEVACE